MKKRISKKDLVTIIIFLCLLLLFSYIPLTGDDWQNYGNGRFSIIDILIRTKRYYFNWEGRLSSRFLIFSLTCNKWLWNVFASLSVLTIVHYASKIINSSKKYMFLIFLSLLFLCNYNVFTQCFFWLAGHITYTIPTSILLIYLYYYLKKENWEFNFFKCLFFSLLNLFLCTFVENIAVSIIVANIIIFINYFISKKKINIELLLNIIFSIIGLLIQITSPGTMYRISLEMGEFGNLGLFGKIFYNLGNFIYYQFLINPIMLIMLIFSANLIIRTSVKNKIIRFSLFMFFNVIPFFTVLGSLYVIFPIEITLFANINNYLNVFFDKNNILLIIYWLIFLLGYLMLIIIFIKDKKSKYKLVLLFFTSQSCLGAMLVTPTWSARVVFCTIILNYIISLIIVDIIGFKLNKGFKAVIYLFLFLYLTFLLCVYYNVDKCIKYRNAYIISEADRGSKKISYYYIPERFLCSYFPYSNSYRLAFNNILGVESDVEYELSENYWEDGFIFDVKNAK